MAEEHGRSTIGTGIDGFDTILKDGLPSKSQVLIAGAAGTGKTLMAFQILHSCAKNGIKSAFVAFDEKPDNTIKNIKKTFSSMTDIDELMRKEMLVIGGQDSASKISTNREDESTYSIGSLVSDVEGVIKSNDAEVAVIDSLSFLKLMLGKGILYNKAVTLLTANMRRMGITSIFTLDVPYYDRGKMKFGQELLLFDGIISLYRTIEKNTEELCIEIAKMRGSEHQRKLAKYEITSNGIILK